MIHPSQQSLTRTRLHATLEAMRRSVAFLRFYSAFYLQLDLNLATLGRPTGGIRSLGTDYVLYVLYFQSRGREE